MKPLPIQYLVFPVLALLALSACQQQRPAASTPSPTPLAAATATPTDADLIAQGEYLVKIAGCNDCHTPGYGDVAGAIPKEKWLLGSPIGFHGPWGTTFPANLRLKTADMDDAAWLKYSGELHTRPIMPDFVVRAMKEQDRLAIFRFIKSLGPAGQPAPAYLPPDQEPQAPYWNLVLPPGPPPQGPASR
jgi:mono/diheme cytochrome c family protein